MGPIHHTRDPHDAHSLTKRHADTSKPLPEIATSQTTIVLIGARQVEFRVNRRLLCLASPFFRDQIQSHPSRNSYRPVTLWLPGESATMFALFVQWVHDPAEFRTYLDDAVAAAHDDGGAPAVQDVHWAVVRLHLFAAHLGLHALQDLAMDAIQDLYLKCDWDVAPGLVVYLYTKCEAGPAVRLRRWAVAMVAFSLTVSWHVKFHPQGRETSDPAQFKTLLDRMPVFAADYAMHIRKMRRSRLDLRFKNPQLRIPANDLYNEKRLFGFRECSFHSHRASVGQGPCPHGVDALRSSEVVFSLDDIDTNEIEEEDELDAYGNDAEYVPAGLAPPSNRNCDQSTPRPLFSQRGKGADSLGREGNNPVDNRA